MGIYRTISYKNLANITIWKITESESELFQLCNDVKISEKAYLIKATTQRKQFLASQLLLKKLTIDTLLEKDANGKPFLTNGIHLSISHDSEYVAVMLSNLKCGIDLQSVTTKIVNIKHKFVHSDDYCFISNDLEELTLAWSAKEALYKINGDPMVYFKDHLRLTTVNKEDALINAQIIHENYSQKVNLRYRKLDDILIVYTIV